MAKHKIACAVTAAAIIAGSGLFTPIRSWAETANDAAVVSEGAGAEDAVSAAVARYEGKEYSDLNEIFADINSNLNNETPWEVTLLRDAEMNCTVVNTGANFVFDLGGHTLTMTGDTVGSNGTETNNWQLLKDSTVVFKNGTIRSHQTSETSKLMIQNYSNLTLENITLDGTQLRDPAGGKWVLSINNGEVKILGNTSIKAASDGVAFGAAWNRYYTGGAQVTVDTTGTIEGPTKLNFGSGASESDIKTTMDIKNGTFKGDVTVAEKMTNQMKISGGTFANNISDYVNTEGGYVSYATINDTFRVVEKDMNFGIAGDGTLTLEAGYEGDALNDLLVAPEDYAAGWVVTLKDGDPTYATLGGGQHPATYIKVNDIVKETETFTVNVAAVDNIVNEDITVTIKNGAKGLSVGAVSEETGTARIDFAKPISGTDLRLDVTRKDVPEGALALESKLQDVYDITVMDGDTVVPVEDNEMTITAGYYFDDVYDNFQIAYIKDGKIAEFIDIEDHECNAGTPTEDGGSTVYCELTFKTNHLSEYGAAGSDTEFEKAELRNAALAASTPDTGALTGTEETGSLDTTALVATVIVMTLATAGMEIALWKKRQNSKN